jgi:DNA-binding response OmpR family regulator
VTKKNAKILVVEDEPEWLELIREVLAERDFEILGTSDPVEAFEILETQPLDLVILDVKMPLNGRALLWFAQRYRPEVVVVVHSAFGYLKGDPDFEGAHRFVVKSPDCVELVETVDTLLGSES